VPDTAKQRVERGIQNACDEHATRVTHECGLMNPASWANLNSAAGFNRNSFSK
jgi:hypothetical protein